MTPLLHAAKTDGFRLLSLHPGAAMPGGEVEILGAELHSIAPASLRPSESGAPMAPTLLGGVKVGDLPAHLSLSRPDRAVIRVPEGAISGDVVLARADGRHSNPLELKIAVPMAENLHPVSNPAVDADGTVYATVSGARGQAVPVSIFSIARDFQMRPFAREILNATGLAFGPDGFLYVSSRAEGTVYRISPAGAISTYAEGMGIATGIAFDPDGNLYVGDRSGTIFKVGPQRSGHDSIAGTAGLGDREMFVYATLEPSVAAYHLAFNADGVLLVTGPTTSSNQAIWAIDRSGETSVFYRGLGRAQGMAFDVHGNLYVAASLQGQRGIVRITPGREASLAVSGNNLVGLAFLEDGCAALATRDALHHVCLGIEGRKARVAATLMASLSTDNHHFRTTHCTSPIRTGQQAITISPFRGLLTDHFPLCDFTLLISPPARETSCVYLLHRLQWLWREESMNRRLQPALTAFALGLMALGFLALLYGDFALVWQPVPISIPARSAIAYTSGLLMLFGGIGLLFRASAAWSSRILFPYLFLWLLLKVPALVVAPAMEAVWLGFGEIAVLFAAGWVLFATLGETRPALFLASVSGHTGIRLATMLFGLALIPIGLSHLIYTKQTVDLIPVWFPFRTALAYVTGAGQIGCGVAVLFSIFPRLAALIEAGMVSLFAIFVWAPAILGSPKARLPWTAFFITWFFASSAWLVSRGISDDAGAPRAGSRP